MAPSTCQAAVAVRRAALQVCDAVVDKEPELPHVRAAAYGVRSRSPSRSPSHQSPHATLRLRHRCPTCIPLSLPFQAEESGGDVSRMCLLHAHARDVTTAWTQHETEVSYIARTRPPGGTFLCGKTAACHSTRVPTVKKIASTSHALITPRKRPRDLTASAPHPRVESLRSPPVQPWGHL